jgi:iron-sulfur cluster assembly accessory protein
LLLVVLLAASHAPGCREEKKTPAQPPARTAPAAPAGPPQGTVVFQPMFVWADGTTTLQGTGFFAAAPAGRVAAVTSAHFINKDGPRLLEARWINVRSGDTAATFSTSWGTPGDGGRTEPQPDLRADYLLLPAAKAPHRAAVLEFDPRPKPALGERIHFPNKDESADPGHKWVEGAVTEADEKSVSVLLDQKIHLQSQSGSPVISQATGRVIGILSLARQERDRTVLTLAPAGGVAAALAGQPANLPLRDVIGRQATAQRASDVGAATRAASGAPGFDYREVVQLTEAAAKAVTEAARLKQLDLAKTAYLRAGVKPRPGGGFDYLLDITQEVNPQADWLGASRGIRIVVARQDAAYLAGTIVDYKAGETSGFIFNNPNARKDAPE